MYALDLCRICLSASTNKNIRDLKICENDNSESCVEILLFCLDIQVEENSTIFTKLCGKCYETILTYHKFKTLALRNDHYLKIIKQSTVKLDQIGINNWEYNENEDTEQTNFDSELSQNSLDSEIIDRPECVLEIDNANVKLDVEVKVENVNSVSDDNILSSFIKPIEVEKVQSPIKGNEKTSVKGNCKPGNGDQLSSNIKVTEKEQDPIKESEKSVKGNSKSGDGDLLSSIIEAEQEQSQIKENKKLMTEEVLLALVDDLLGVIKPTEVQKNQSPIIENKKSTKEVVNVQVDKQQTHSADPAKLKHVCESCGKPCLSNAGLQRHMRVHYADMHHKCDICHKRFLKASDLDAHRHLKSHMVIHTKEKKYPCQYCGKRFDLNISVNIHQKTVHGKLLPSPGQLDQPAASALENTHNPQRERKFHCERCDKKFYTKQNLKKHMVVHTNHERQLNTDNPQRERKFHCEHCDKKFYTKQVIENHMVVHTKDKKYPCKYCGKRFGTNSGVWMHEKYMHKKHTFTAFHCDRCDKKFYTKQLLQNHMVVHTKEKKYPCKYCGKRFSTNSNARKHQRYMHEEHFPSRRKFHCDRCDKKFYSKQ